MGSMGSELLVPAPDDPRLHETAEALREAGGDAISVLALYGSHVQASTPDRWSAYDFLLVTDSYGTLFRNLTKGGHHSRPAWLLTALNYFLPPNIVSFDLGREDGAMAKCAVVNPRHLRRALRRHSPDHFLKGRVVQKLALVWSRGPAEGERLRTALRMAREGIVHWVRPFMPKRFSLEEFAETMLRVSYRGEIRPENPGRVVQVFKAQKPVLLGIAAEALESAERSRVVIRDGGTFRWAKNPGLGSKLYYHFYFGLSKVRATARWFKYMITFDGWLDYVVRKIERRAGFTVEVEERERRWPLIFLWPKLFKVLHAVRQADAKIEKESNGDGG
jgi:hypothetical protein